MLAGETRLLPIEPVAEDEDRCSDCGADLTGYAEDHCSDCCEPLGTTRGCASCAADQAEREYDRREEAAREAYLERRAG